jgi:hypothetical protein
MQETRNKRQLILLVVLVVATLLAFWWVQPENRVKIDQDIFQVPDLRSVSKVELMTDTSSVILQFNGARWEVNGSGADGNMINVLFATLQQARPRRMVARATRDSMYTQLERSGVHVMLYSADNLQKTFFAGGNTARTQAFFADPASKEVYVMSIPGYRVYVSGIFELPESGWWDKLVFGFNWANFKSLKAGFPRRPEDSFAVSRSRQQFGLDGLVETDTAKLNTFLDDVSLLTVDRYVPEPKLKDSLSHVPPSVTLLVTDIGNRSYKLDLFGVESPRRVFGIIGDARVAVFAPRKIRRLVRPKSYFKKK